MRGGVGGVERGAAQLDLLLRREHVAKRDIDARGEPDHGGLGGRAGGGEIGAAGGAAARRFDQAEHRLDRVELVVVAVAEPQHDVDLHRAEQARDRELAAGDAELVERRGDARVVRDRDAHRGVGGERPGQRGVDVDRAPRAEPAIEVGIDGPAQLRRRRHAGGEQQQSRAHQWW